MKKTFKKNNLILELDKSQVFPEDPGKGTPAIVKIGEYYSTFWCAIAEGCLESNLSIKKLSSSQLKWLDSLQDEVENFLYK